MRLEFKDFLRNLESSKYSFYFFTGPEEYPKLRVKDRMMALPRFQGFVRTIVSANELKPQDLFDKFSQPQLFNAGEVVVIQQVDRLPAAAKKALLELLENPSPGQPVLICMTDNERVDAADPLEGYAFSSPQAAHVFFPILTDMEVMGWAKGELKRKNIEAPPEVLDTVASVYGNELYSWANFIKSLEMYLGDRRKADKKDVETLLNSATPREEAAWRELEQSVFQMLERDGDGETLAALLGQLEQFIESASDSTESCVIRVYQLLGERVYELASSKAGVVPSRRFPYVSYQGLIRQAAPKWNWEEIKQLYAFVLDGERHMKTGLMEAKSSAIHCLSRLWELSVPAGVS